MRPSRPQYVVQSQLRVYDTAAHLCIILSCEKKDVLAFSITTSITGLLQIRCSRHGVWTTTATPLKIKQSTSICKTTPRMQVSIVP
jgi:hypothetical protein